MITFLIVLLLILIFFSAYTSLSETALFSLSSAKIKTYKQESDSRKQVIAKLLANPKDLLITLIILNTVVNILIQNVVSTIFGSFSLWILNVGVPLALTLIFGEVLPKSIGLANNDRLSLKVAPSVDIIQKLMYPIRVALTKITNAVSRLLFFFLRKEEEISVGELEHALDTSRQSGVLNEDEAELVRGFLHLQKASVKQLMRPREEVIYFDLESSIEELISLFVDKECSRIPVCKEGLDNVIGVVTSRLFFLHRYEIKKTEDLVRILQKPYFAPESIAAKSLLRKMYEKEIDLAVLVDEYGSVSGLISIEDLIETVIGEIVDRRDEKHLFTRSGEDVLIASGKLELATLFDIFGINLISENQMVTLGGWLTEQWGDIPKAGAKLEKQGFLFHVLASEPNRVKRIYVRRLTKDES